ncbi:hypothetical protein L2E82_17611 [Cichorium intybus]|uniref:Uncharacterized protein n=1 Tax=Cichorium intybus TaxID=13427 RepID=A0ACB9F9L3_CICIN|nr:hypothetical protein L2E82_17611 [Cichorium intybus]
MARCIRGCHVAMGIPSDFTASDQNQFQFQRFIRLSSKLCSRLADSNHRTQQSKCPYEGCLLIVVSSRSAAPIYCYRLDRRHGGAGRRSRKKVTVTHGRSTRVGSISSNGACIRRTDSSSMEMKKLTVYEALSKAEEDLGLRRFAVAGDVIVIVGKEGITEKLGDGDEKLPPAMGS